VWKDLALFFGDRNGAILTILTPALLAALIGSIFAPSEDTGRLELLVVDQQQSELSRAFVARVSASPSFTVHIASTEEATDTLARGKGTLALVLEPGFDEQLNPIRAFTGSPLQLGLWRDPAHNTEASMAEGLLTDLAMRHMMELGLEPKRALSWLELARTGTQLARATNTYDGPAGLPSVLDAAVTMMQEEAKAPGTEPTQRGGAALASPVSFDRLEVHAQGAAKGYNSYAHNFSGMLAMFLLFMGLDRARNLIEERNLGTLVRLRLAPIHPGVVLAGHALATFVLGLAIAACVYGLGMAVFDVQVLGSWLGFAGAVAGLSLFVAGFALFLAGVGRTAAQVSSMGVFVILIASFAGGVWMPSFLLPDWLGYAQTLLPTAWSMEALAAATWRGLPAQAALVPAAELAAVGVLLGLLGSRRFRWS
jgi:ABC-2 type transport system permease protein